jgi:adenine-specific DNA-methyltransferase
MVTVTSGIGDVYALVDLAARLGAATVPGWSGTEQRLAATARQHSQRNAGPAVDLAALRASIQAGEDPLGEVFCRLRGRAERRALGQTFTPQPVIESMISGAARAARAARAAGAAGVSEVGRVGGASGASGVGTAGGASEASGVGTAGGVDGAGRRDLGRDPVRVVDPGSGSARFLIAAGRRWPLASLVGVEIDPVAAIIGRASLAAAGLADRSRVLLEDYREVRLAAVRGPTLFLGNPPYLRHHQIAAGWKTWLRSTAQAMGLRASGLAGLHVHFFLATAVHAVPGDLGVFITAAEWLDVNYGSLVRGLLLGALGGESVHLIEPAVPVFGDAMATSAISCFRPGRAPDALRFRLVGSLAGLGSLAGGTAVPARSLSPAGRWGAVLRAPAPGLAGGRGGQLPRLAAGDQDGPAPGPAAAAAPGLPAAGAPALAAADAPGLPAASRGGRPPAGQIELGELCRVHRGQVTGANAVWVVAPAGVRLPERFLFPAVTRARELFQAWDVLPVGAALRSVIDLPADLSDLTAAELRDVESFLSRARAAGAADGYIARHRRPWWRVRLGEPPPILATYMARRPPAFVRNLAGARFLNIAHGIYPREPLPVAALDGLAAFLRGCVMDGRGRVYAGGLVKFEPGEMQRLTVPRPDLLAAYAGPPAAGQVRSSRGTTSGTATMCTG